jgi:thioredoxin-related protein
MHARLPLITRRQSLHHLAWGLGVFGSLAAHAAETSLPLTASLPESLQQALQRKQPLVVMVSLHGCPFCKVVRENYLMPLQREGLPVVQLNMRSAQAIADFDASVQTHDGLIRKWGVQLAPTVLFFGPQGQEVAKRLKGAYLVDFYSAYLDEQLAQARQNTSLGR